MCAGCQPAGERTTKSGARGLPTHCISCPPCTCYQTAGYTLPWTLCRTTQRAGKPRPVSASRFGLIQHHRRSRLDTQRDSRRQRNSLCQSKSGQRHVKISRSSSLCSHREQTRNRDRVQPSPPSAYGEPGSGSCWFVLVAWCLPAHSECTGLGGAERGPARTLQWPRPALGPRDAPSPFSAPRSTSCSCPAGCSAGTTMQQA